MIERDKVMLTEREVGSLIVLESGSPVRLCHGIIAS
jgi:hypothetical protein